MVWDLVVGSLVSSTAGLVLALTTAVLTDYREKLRRLESNVHQPLYGELTGVISGELPAGDAGYESLWADLDYYKTYRVDADLAEALDQYASDVSQLRGVERDEDVEAFVDALPAYICEPGESTVELPSGRTVDMRTWLERNLLVLSTAPSYRDVAFGIDPADLSYLWAEVDGVSPADVEAEPFDTATALEVVSQEFTWGYEALYNQWDDGWLDDLAAALATAADQPDSAVQETLLLRHDIGTAASETKAMIEERADRGLFRSLWHVLVRGRGRGRGP